MSQKKKNLSEYKTNVVPSAIDMKFGIIVSEWNEKITFSLKDACVKTLQEHGANEEDIKIIYVPGAFELPMAANMMLVKENLSAVICLGCVIKGETKHDEYISHAVANGLVNLGMLSGKPVIYGVLTPNNMTQALDRSGGKHGNKGVEAAISAIKMASLSKDMGKSKKRIGF